MKRFSWESKLGAVLVLLTVVLHLLIYAIYHDMNHIVLWGLTNLAFLPVSVLFVSLIINNLMIERERAQKLEKLNMLIGTFYSVTGVKLLRCFSQWDRDRYEIVDRLTDKTNWSKGNYTTIREFFSGRHYKIDEDRVDLQEVKEILAPSMDFLIGLLENPHLFEHESFTEVLRGVFHLTEELNARTDINELPHSDRQHLIFDIERAYGILLTQWIDYMEYLQSEYPYLFSFALRTNPFDENASAIVSRAAATEQHTCPVHLCR